MRKIAKLLTVLLTMSLILMLFACGGDTTCTSHTDEDSNGKCDTCGETVENNENNGNTNTTSAIDLIKDGKVNFQIVRSSTSGGGVMMMLNTLKTTVESLGGTLDIVDDKAGNEKDIEVLIGDVTSRGEKYTYDKYSLGMKGYVIKVIDNKIIVNAGSADTLSDALEEFIEKILGVKSNTKTLSDVTMTSEKDIIEIQDDYRITSVKINNNDIKGYTIAYDLSNSTHATAASSLNKFLYEKAGYYLPLVKLEDAGKSIIIEAVDYAGEEGFLIKTDESGALRVQCAYSNAFEEAWNEFFSDLRIKTGDISFDSSYKYTKLVSVVTYEKFFAVGDGVTDDYAAIKKTHDYANAGGQTVKATNGKTYYIHDLRMEEGGAVSSIFIKTDVDWGTAKFIIDDRGFNVSDPNNRPIFRIVSDRTKEVLTGDDARALFPDGKMSRDVTKISWSGYDALLLVYNEDHINHIRYGGDANDGRVQHELFIVDENGNISSETPCLYAYEDITKVEIWSIDDAPLTVKGGIFTTIANDIPTLEHIYFSRGINIQRSNAILKDTEHYMTGEINYDRVNNVRGPSYTGFYRVETSNNVLLEDLVLTGRRYYELCGTYDFSTTYSNNLVLKGCTQSNFHLLDENGNSTGVNSLTSTYCWGVGISELSKNLTYDSCVMSRFDSHSSLFGGKIINSKITAIYIIGGGEMLIENCEIELVSSNLILLRTDYGATWDGTVTIKDCNVTYNGRAASEPETMEIFAAAWTNHNFGYACHMPNLVLDNLTFESKVHTVNIISEAGVRHDQFHNDTVYSEKYLHEQYLSDGTYNINPYIPPKKIELKNNKSHVVYKIASVPFFENTAIIGDIMKIKA